MPTNKQVSSGIGWQGLINQTTLFFYAGLNLLFGFCFLLTRTEFEINRHGKDTNPMTANGKARFGKDFLDTNAGLTDKACPDTVAGYCDTSLVQPPETTLLNEPKDTYRARFMAGKEKEYLATEEAYQQLYESPSNQHLYGIRHCRTFATLKRDFATGDVKVFGDSCRDRWCPMCAGQKAAFAKDQTLAWIKTLVAPRFLTLTLKHNEAGLEHQIKFLQQSFSKLRTRAFWKKNVTGGIWFLHIKRGTGDGCWHPHVHILLDGNYLEQGRLSELWDQVTFGSPVIDIRRVHNPESAASYVSRYVARPASMVNMPLADRVEVIEALFRKRLCGTFGTAKAVTLTPPKIESDVEWDYIGHFDDIARKAEKDPVAREIMVAYNNYEPLSLEVYEKFTGHPPGFVSIMSKPKKVERQLYLDFYNTG